MLLVRLLLLRGKGELWWSVPFTATDERHSRSSSSRWSPSHPSPFPATPSSTIRLCCLHSCKCC